MKTSEYHAIVLGSGIGGLVCAALLTRRGLRVLVLEPGDQPGGCNGMVDREPYRFGLGTSVAWGFHEGDVIHNLLTELGCLDDLLHNQRLIQRLHVPLQVILPYHRLNVYSQRALLYQEVERELREDLDELRVFYETLDALADLLDRLKVGYPFVGYPVHGIRGSLRRSTASGALRDCQRQLEHIFSGGVIRPETRAFLAAQARFFGAIPFTPQAILQLASLYRLPQRGVYTFRGGGRGFAKFLAERVRAFGGSIVYGAGIDELLLKGSRVMGVRARLEGSPVTLTAEHTVANLSLEFLLTHLLREAPQLGRLKKRFLQGRRRWVTASMLLGVDDAVIPDPMANQALLIPDETLAPAGENLIFLSVNPAWDDSRAPAGKRSLSVTTYLASPQNGIDNLPSVDEAFCQRLLRRLGRVLPFLSSAIDYRALLQPSDYLEATLRPADDLVRLEGLLQEPGLSGLPLHLGLKNLLLVGSDSYLGPSCAASVMSGWLAAEAANS